VLGMTSESAESLTSKVLQQKTPRAWSEDMQCVMERSRDGGQSPPPRMHGSLQRRVRHCGEDIQEGWKWTSEGWADRQVQDSGGGTVGVGGLSAQKRRPLLPSVQPK
jgi:hypothetical protein